MMIDFALEAERSEGKTPREAIYQACLLRFRPIMMTTMAALLGALPLALGSGVGSELRRPLGIAIVGGLIISQMLTLYTTPVIYLYLDRLRLWLKSGRAGGGGAGIATLLLIVALCALLPACSVGPNYVRPPVETPNAYKEISGWKRAEPRDHVSRGAWWKLFNDPELNTLEARVDISNQNVATAEAQYREAVAQVKIARSGYFPTITMGASWTRSSGSTTTTTGSAGTGAVIAGSSTTGTATFGGRRVTTSDYLLPAQMTWELDVWGRVRRLVEEGVASAQASAADLEGVRLSSQALLAQDYFQLRGLDAQQRLLNDAVAAYRRALQITRNEY